MRYVINIGRQLGSGGRIIGEKLAQQLKIAYYDKELIRIAAKESGLCPEWFEHADEKGRSGLFGSFFGFFSNPLNEGYCNDNYSRNDFLFKVQSDVIQQLAEKQSCIFIGRCADYVLRDHPHGTNIFLSANLGDRIRKVSESGKISEEKARELIERTDKQRAAYYNYYSGKTWGMAASYHLCINSSVLGMDETTDFIRSFVEKKLKL